MKMHITVERSVIDHTKCQELVFAYESCIVGGHLRGEGPTHLLLERMYCMQFRGYDICKSM